MFHQYGAACQLELVAPSLTNFLPPLAFQVSKAFHCSYVHTLGCVREIRAETQKFAADKNIESSRKIHENKIQYRRQQSHPQRTAGIMVSPLLRGCSKVQQWPSVDMYSLGNAPSPQVVYHCQKLFQVSIKLHTYAYAMEIVLLII